MGYQHNGKKILQMGMKKINLMKMTNLNQMKMTKINLMEMTNLNQMMMKKILQMGMKKINLMFFLLPTHMSQKGKEITETSKNNFYRLSLAEKKVKKHTKMINIFRFFFFPPTSKANFCSFSM